MRLLSFFKKGGHILGSQYGFRSGHSTDMAILDMVERILKAWEDGDHCLGVFIDFRKAFDTVDHCILLSKLEHLGIRGSSLELLRSYLSNRNQYVIFNGTESPQQQISVGVPQGSILGPLFFLLYINDLSRASSSTFFLLMIPTSLLRIRVKGFYIRGLMKNWVNYQTGLRIINLP